MKNKIKHSELFEDLYLEKNNEKKLLYIKSDRPTKNGRYYETSSLSNEFKKNGFRWDKNSGYWVGSFDKLNDINKIIEKNNKIKKIIETLDKISDFVENDINLPSDKKNELNKKIEGYIDDLSNAVDQATMDEKILKYLNFINKFPKYSLANTWLIFIQNPNATKVLAFNKWKKYNRHVKKDAKAIYIWFPMKSKIEDLSGDEIKTPEIDVELKSNKKNDGDYTIKYGLGSVYDISDTEVIKNGKPENDIPEEPKWYSDNTPSEIADELISRLKLFADSHGIKLTKDESERGEKGFSAGGHINLSSDISGVAEASTLIHELAHELLHWKKSSPLYIGDEEGYEDKKLKRDLFELQAESVAYVVLRHYDLPADKHPTYLALWNANKEKIKNSMDIIKKCSQYIVNGIDNVSEEEVDKENIKNNIQENFKRFTKYKFNL